MIPGSHRRRWSRSSSRVEQVRAYGEVTPFGCERRDLDESVHLAGDECVPADVVSDLNARVVTAGNAVGGVVSASKRSR
jgi:hypothetical protein